MELTAFALWLNTFFAGYDRAILTLMNGLGKILGVLLTPLMKLVTLLGEKGILFFLAALVLMCFARTRKIGVCLFGAVACGALITNIILKDWVARPRPFEAEELYRHLRPRHRRGGGHDRPEPDPGEEVDLALGDRGAGHGHRQELPDGPLSLRCALCRGHRPGLRLHRLGDHQADLPLPGGARRSELVRLGPGFRSASAPAARQLRGQAREEVR